MLNISFALKEPNSKDKTLIYMFVFFGGKRPLKYSVSEKIHPDAWNATSKRVRELKTVRNAKEINAKIDRYETAAKKAGLDLENSNKNVNVDSLKEAISVILGKIEEKDDVVYFLPFYKEFAEKKKTTGATTAKSYLTAINVMSDFIGENVNLKFENIDYAFYEEFVSYLTKKNYSINYISAHIKMLKVVMDYATRIKVNTNIEFRDFPKPTEEIDNIYLTEDEINVIYNLELNGYLDRARDLFIIGCCTGMRFSDFTQIRKENIKNGFISITTQKTTERIIVPIHWMVDEIINKYDGDLPKAISNQKMNDYLKEIGEKAKINTKVTKTRTNGGRKVKTVYEKCKLITTHTARRSAATNMYKAGIPTLAIMKITGHRTEEAFLKYIKISKEENAEMLANHPFFSKKNTPAQGAAIK